MDTCKKCGEPLETCPGNAEDTYCWCDLKIKKLKKKKHEYHKKIYMQTEKTGERIEYFEGNDIEHAQIPLESMDTIRLSVVLKSNTDIEKLLTLVTCLKNAL